jgi:hypothetical protein
LLAYLVDELPSDANQLFLQAEQGECELLIPEIALGEVFYTIYKGKEIFGKILPLETIDFILQILTTAVTFHLIPMDLECWRIFTTLDFYELHDRMIVATTIAVGAQALITDDPEISKHILARWI